MRLRARAHAQYLMHSVVELIEVTSERVTRRECALVRECWNLWNRIWRASRDETEEQVDKCKSGFA